MLDFDHRSQSDKKRNSSEKTDTSGSGRMSNAAAGSLMIWTICILTVSIIAVFAAGMAFAADETGADAHSPSMTAGSGDEPIEDESTTKDYVSTGNAEQDSAANGGSSGVQTDDSAAQQGDAGSADSGSDEKADTSDAAAGVADDADANDDSDSGESGGSGFSLKGLSGLMSGVPAIVLIAFAVLLAAMIIVLFTIRISGKKRRKKKAYKPRH